MIWLMEILFKSFFPSHLKFLVQKLAIINHSHKQSYLLGGCCMSVTYWRDCHEAYLLPFQIWNLEDDFLLVQTRKQFERVLLLSWSANVTGTSLKSESDEWATPTFLPPLSQTCACSKLQSQENGPCVYLTNKTIKLFKFDTMQTTLLRRKQGLLITCQLHSLSEFLFQINTKCSFF